MKSRPTADGASYQEYYDERFEGGYMDEWPAWKKRRVAALFREQGLGPSGRLLEFGCGQGVFTEVVRQTLPGWEIFGSDLSTVALRAAGERFPGCRFIHGDDIASFAPYDVIFTHHVLEHVDELDRVLTRLAGWLSDDGYMVHILPCGNTGSLEHGLAKLRTDGIEPGSGRFFLDEAGHLRRLGTKGLEDSLAGAGLSLVAERYANQYWGAINWMTDLEFDGLREILDPSKAVDPPAMARLGRTRAALVALRLLKRPPALLFRQACRKILARPQWTWRDRAVLVAANPMFAAAFGLRKALRSLADREWARRSHDRGGSEMYLVFRKKSTTGV